MISLEPSSLSLQGGLQRTNWTHDRSHFHTEANASTVRSFSVETHSQCANIMTLPTKMPSNMVEISWCSRWILPHNLTRRQPVNKKVTHSALQAHEQKLPKWDAQESMKTENDIIVDRTLPMLCTFNYSTTLLWHAKRILGAFGPSHVDQDHRLVNGRLNQENQI